MKLKKKNIRQKEMTKGITFTLNACESAINPTKQATKRRLLDGVGGELGAGSPFWKNSSSIQSNASTSWFDLGWWLDLFDLWAWVEWVYQWVDAWVEWATYPQLALSWPTTLVSMTLFGVAATISCLMVLGVVIIVIDDVEANFWAALGTWAITVVFLSAVKAFTGHYLTKFTKAMAIDISLLNRVKSPLVTLIEYVGEATVVFLLVILPAVDKGGDTALLSSAAKAFLLGWWSHVFCLLITTTNNQTPIRGEVVLWLPLFAGLCTCIAALFGTICCLLIQ